MNIKVSLDSNEENEGFLSEIEARRKRIEIDEKDQIDLLVNELNEYAKKLEVDQIDYLDSIIELRSFQDLSYNEIKKELKFMYDNIKKSKDGTNRY